MADGMPEGAISRLQVRAEATVSRMPIRVEGLVFKLPLRAKCSRPYRVLKKKKHVWIIFNLENYDISFEPTHTVIVKGSVAQPGYLLEHF